MKIGAIIVAAGSGSRMGAGKNKVFLELLGKTVLEHTAEAFDTCSEIDTITVVASDVEFCRSLLSGYEKVEKIVPGGKTRQESVKNGLFATDCDIVLIHDGARALIGCDEIVKTICAVKSYGAAAVGVKCKDTLKQASDGGFIEKTIDREFIYNIQTPQGFKYADIKALHERYEGEAFTDDCALAEEGGIPVKIVEGSYDNIKLTTPEDMEIAEKILKRRVVK